MHLPIGHMNWTGQDTSYSISKIKGKLMVRSKGSMQRSKKVSIALLLPLCDDTACCIHLPLIIYDFVNKAVHTYLFE